MPRSLLVSLQCVALPEYLAFVDRLSSKKPGRLNQWIRFYSISPGFEASTRLAVTFKSENVQKTLGRVSKSPNANEKTRAAVTEILDGTAARYVESEKFVSILRRQPAGLPAPGHQAPPRGLALGEAPRPPARPPSRRSPDPARSDDGQPVHGPLLGAPARRPGCLSTVPSASPNLTSFVDGLELRCCSTTSSTRHAKTPGHGRAAPVARRPRPNVLWRLSPPLIGRCSYSRARRMHELHHLTRFT